MFLSESCLQKPTEMGEGWTSSDERRTGPEVDDPPWRPQMLIYKQTKWFDEKMKEHVVHNRLQETKSHFCDCNVCVICLYKYQYLKVANICYFEPLMHVKPTYKVNVLYQKIVLVF